MSKFPTNMADRAAGKEAAPAATDASDLSSLFNYPSLGRLFEGTDAIRALAEMRARLRRTNQDLERVVRQGTKEEAARAACIAHAYGAALNLLDNLEQLQRAPK